MKNIEIANSANYKQTGTCNKIIAESLSRLIRALGIINGSVKIYVHQGRWGQRLEIQHQVSHEVEVSD